MKKRALIFLSIFFVVSTSGAKAETIELKDGKTIVGEIVQKTEEAVTVSKRGGGFIYSISRDRIKNIRDSTPEEIKEQEMQTAGGYTVDKKTGEDRQEKIKKYRLEKYEEEVLAAKKARGRIKIKFSKNRFGVVDVLLNRKVTASLLVDTGASLVVISREIAAQLGIEDLDKKGKIHVVLADGSITTAIPITLDSVEIGSSKVKDVRAAVSETPPGTGLSGLLGMSFLSHFHVKLDSDENCLVLEKY